MLKHSKKIIFFFTLFFSCPLLAKEWNSNLLEASKLAYGGETTAALQLINNYISQNPDDPNGLFVKANVLDWKTTLNWEDKNQQKEILELYKKANSFAFHQWNKDQENVDKLINLGNSYLFLGRKYSDLNKGLDAVLTAKKCQKYLEKAIEKDASRSDALLALGGFHYLSDQIPPWLKSFRFVLGIKGDKNLGLSELKKSSSVKHPFYYDALYALMSIYMDFEKQYDIAIQYLEGLEKEFPNNPEFKFIQGRLKERIGKKEGLEAFYNLGSWCQKNSKHCHTEYSFLGFYHSGRLANDLSEKDKAQSLWAKALEFDSQFHPLQKAEAFYWSGNIDLHAGRKKEAQQKFQQALQVKAIPKKLKEEIERKIKTVSL